MKKKVVSTILAAAMTLASLTGFSVPAAAEEVPNIVVVYAWNELPANLDEIESRLSEIAEEKIGATVTLQGFTYGNLMQQMSLTLASPSEQWDCLPGMFRSGLAGFVAQGQLNDMTDLLDEYGQDIKDTLGETLLKSGVCNGRIYGLTMLRNNASQTCIVFDKQYIDELGIDVSGVKDYQDLTDIFAQLHEAHPDKYVVASSGTKPTVLINTFNGHDPLSNNLGVLLDASVPEVSNLFESDGYREFLHLTRSWNEAGFVYPDILTDEGNSGANLMKNGLCMSYFTSYTPDNYAEYNALSQSGETVVCPLNSTVLMTAQTWSWTIPTNSAYPDKAMQFINLCYSDPDVISLLCYGIEGENWEVDEDGFAVAIGNEYPDQKTWEIGNGSLIPVQKGGAADHWDQIRAWNDAAVPSAAFGFTFDSTDYAAEETALASVVAQYRSLLEWGFASDVDGKLDEFNEALYAAGLQTYMDAKQEQLDAFVAAE